MRETQKKLLEFLKECERRDRTFTVDQAAEASGLSVASLRTYIPKKMKGLWVEPTDDQHYEVHDLVSVSDREFEHVMTQKFVTAVASVAEWKNQLRELVQLHKEHGYPVRQAVDEVLRAAGLA